LLEPLDPVHFVTGVRVWQEKPVWARALGWCHRALVRVLFGVTLEPAPGWLGSEGRGRRLLARWAFGVRVQDVDCAFRVFRREVFARIPIQSDSAFALVELLAKANFLGFWMAQVPVTWVPPAAGESLVDQHERDRARVEARRLFRDPDFGPPELPAPPTAPASEAPSPPAAEGPLPSPTA
jgi:hypothetical protein